MNLYRQTVTNWIKNYNTNLIKLKKRIITYNPNIEHNFSKY